MNWADKIASDEHPHCYVVPTTVTRAKPGSRGKDLEPTVLEKPDGKPLQANDGSFLDKLHDFVVNEQELNGYGKGQPVALGTAVYMYVCDLLNFDPTRPIIHEIKRTALVCEPGKDWTREQRCLHVPPCAKRADGEEVAYRTEEYGQMLRRIVKRVCRALIKDLGVTSDDFIPDYLLRPPLTPPESTGVGGTT
jgi:hypothetical protein